MSKTGIIFLNFGGPQNEEELEPFLAALFADVLPVPGLLKGLASQTIAKRRSKSVGENYKEIGWSPLVPVTMEQVDHIKRALGDDHPPIAVGMQYTEPSMAAALDELAEQGVDQLVAISMYPHWSFATSGSAYQMLHEALRATGRAHWPVHHAPAFFDRAPYIRALANTIRQGVEAMSGDEEIHLVFTPHGLPVSYIRRGDPYVEHVHESVRRVLLELEWTGPAHVGWQSRVGPVQWLGPSTESVLEKLGKQGVKRVCMVPIAFVSDHIETLHEIDIEYAEVAHEFGITSFGRAPAIGVESGFIECLADLARHGMSQMKRYSCARCLLPKPDSHRRQKSCPNCKFQFPEYMREALPGST